MRTCVYVIVDRSGMDPSAGALRQALTWTWAQALPVALCRRFEVPHHWAILLCGATFGGGHYLNGSLGQGLTTFVGGCVLVKHAGATGRSGLRGPAG
jgi:hypothetical protein